MVLFSEINYGFATEFSVTPNHLANLAVYSLWKSVETIFRTAMMKGEEIYSNFHGYTLRCTIHSFQTYFSFFLLFCFIRCFLESLVFLIFFFFPPFFLFFRFFFFLFVPLLRNTVRKYTAWNTKDPFTYVEQEKGRTCYGKVVEKSQLPEIRTTIKEIKIVCLAWSTTGLPWDSAVFFFTFFFGYVPSGQPMDRSVFCT